MRPEYFNEARPRSVISRHQFLEDKPNGGLAGFAGSGVPDGRVAANEVAGLKIVVHSFPLLDLFDV